MTRFVRAFMAVFVLVLTAGQVQAGPTADELEDMLYLDLKSGRVVIKMFPDIAPKHVARIKKLVRQKFYDGLTFHRVIDGFMAQTGDPKGDGTGGSKLPDLPAEFSDRPFKRGTVGAARSASPDSANSQFFITFANSPWLNGKYTVWGEVISGMEHVDKIKRGHPRSGAITGTPDKIIRMRVAIDVEK